MAEDTLNILDEIERKCQERAEEGDVREGSDEPDKGVDKNDTEAENSDHPYAIKDDKVLDIIQLGSKSDSGTGEAAKTVNGMNGNDHVIVRMNSDTSEVVEDNVTAEDGQGEGDDQDGMDVDDTEETEDSGEQVTVVNGNVSDDNEDRNSDIVDIDVNVNKERREDSDTMSVDLNKENAADNENNHKSSDDDTGELNQGEGEVNDSAISLEGDKSAISQEGDSSDMFDNTGVTNEGDSFESADVNSSPTKLTKARKRRKKWGKGWSAASQNKSRRLTTIIRRSSGEAAADITGEDGAEGDDGSGSRSRQTAARGVRSYGCNADFIIGEEAVDRLIEEGASTSPSKRRKLLIDHGEKVTPGKVQPLAPELFEKYSLPFKNGWKRELVVRGVQGVTPSGKPKTRQTDVYYHPPTGSKIVRISWRREIVVRGVHGETSSPMRKNPPCDVYYWPPVGTKLRSMVQVQDWLARADTNMTCANFSFMRRPIGLEEGEIVRNASASRGRGTMDGMKRRKLGKRVSTEYHDDDNPLYDKPEIVIENDTEDFSPIMAGLGKDLPPVRFDTSCSPFPAPRGRPKRSPITGRPRKFALPQLIRPVMLEKVGMETMHPSNETVIVPPPAGIKIKATARKSTGGKLFKVVKKPIPYSGVESLCTLKCPGLEGMAPMLMCKKCQCLFHNECVNHFDDDLEFTCLRCKDSHCTATANALNSASAEPPPTVLRVSMPVQFDQLDQSGISVTDSGAAISTAEESSSWSLPLPVASLIGGSFPAPRASSPIVNTSPALTSALSSAASPSMCKLYPNVSKYPQIRPLIKVKDEPKDSSYDNARLSSGNQASLEAIGSLKTVLNARHSPAGSKDYDLFQGGDISRSRVSPQMSTPIMTNMLKNRRRGSPLVRTPVNLLTNSSLPLQQNSNFRLVPIGPPVSLPNIPFQPIRLPGMTVQGLMPMGNVQLPIPTMPSSSNLTFGDLKKTTSAKSSAPQSLNSLSNMVSMVETQGKQSTEKSPAKTSNQAARLVIDGTQIGAPESGQLLTLPGAVSKKLTLNKPLVLKIKNRQISVPPSGFFQAKDGLKIFVPPNTFPTAEEELENSSEKGTAADKNTSPTKPAVSSPSKSSPSKSQSSVSCEEKTKDSSAVASSKATDEICRTRRYKKCCLIQKLYGGYDCMYHIFRHLNIKELMAVSLVCRTWKMISLHPSLWNEASFRGLRVSSWPKAMQFLKSRGVSCVSLLGMTPYEDLERTWNGFITSVGEVPSLQKVTFGLVPPLILDSACLKLTNLQSLCAQCVSSEDGESMWTTPTRLDIGKFGSLTGLKELRLKGVCGLTLPTFSLCGGIGNLASLIHLETLSLTSLKNVEGSKFHFISELSNLRELALGECKSWSAETYAVLGEQTSLRKLRLEHGGKMEDVGLGEAIGKLQNLHTLELYTYTIADTFADHIKQLPKLRTLVIWPDNNSQPAQVNTNTLAAVRDLLNLDRLKWVIQNQANNSIILDEDSNSETLSKEHEWIPFVSDNVEGAEGDGEEEKTEYVGVRQLTENLSTLLPDTHINVYCLKADQENQETF